MPLPRHNGSHTSTVSPSSAHAEDASVEPDGILDLASGNVHLDAVVNPDGRVWEANGSTIRGVQEGDILRSSLDLTDTAQLVLSLSCGDAVHDEPALHVVDDAEVLAGLLDLDDIHEASWKLGISPELPINLDQALLTDSLDLLHGKGILQAVPEEQSNRQRLSLFVGSRAWLDGKNTSQFVQHP